MSYTLDTHTLTVQGLEFTVEIEQDHDLGPPWQEHDGHGTVRQTSKDNKRPGEYILQAGRNPLLYDWQGAMKQAKEEGWQTSPPSTTAKAVQADFDFLRAYVAHDWVWAYITVSRGNETDSIGGVEFWQHYSIGHGKNIYAIELATEMADELANKIHKERKEAQYWAERDTVTA